MVVSAGWPAIRQEWEVVVKINEGGFDRVLRIVVGGVLVALAWKGTIGAWGWIGVVPLATGAIGMCPLYGVLGISTCPMKKAG